MNLLSHDAENVRISLDHFQHALDVGSKCAPAPTLRVSANCHQQSLAHVDRGHLASMPFPECEPVRETGRRIVMVEFYHEFVSAIRAPDGPCIKLGSLAPNQVLL